MIATQPTPDELLHAMALLIVEGDALRASSGKMTLGEGRRTYTRERLDEAKQLKPTATFGLGGSLVVSING
ncbi:MAG TPA: hypothetical protein VF443_15620 [Nitrospira sp.]